MTILESKGRLINNPHFIKRVILTKQSFCGLSFRFPGFLFEFENQQSKHTHLLQFSSLDIFFFRLALIDVSFFRGAAVRAYLTVTRLMVLNIIVLFLLDLNAALQRHNKPIVFILYQRLVILPTPTKITQSFLKLLNIKFLKKQK